MKQRIDEFVSRLIHQVGSIPMSEGNVNESKASGGVAARMSAQMDAVMRLMTGREERSIKEKIADANRPTWEQYKKENEDKLNLEGVDQRKMEEYRRELDEQRDKMLARGRGDSSSRKKKKKKRKRSRQEYSDEESFSSESSGESRHRRKREKSHKKRRKKEQRKRRKHGDKSDSDSSHGRHHRRKKRPKKSSEDRSDEAGESDGSHYRLSTFFNQDSE